MTPARSSAQLSAQVVAVEDGILGAVRAGIKPGVLGTFTVFSYPHDFSLTLVLPAPGDTVAFCKHKFFFCLYVG